MNLNFGVPSTRTKKVDEFEGKDVLIMHPKPTEKGKSTRFELSNNAAKTMNFQDGGEIASSFDNGKMFLANTVKGQIPTALNLTKSNAFSNAKLYNYVVKTFNIDPTVRNVFPLLLLDIDNVDNVNSLVEVQLDDACDTDISSATFDNDESMDEVFDEVNVHAKETQEENGSDNEIVDEFKENIEKSNEAVNSQEPSDFLNQD